MRPYTEDDLQHYERLVTNARGRLARHQQFVEQLSDRQQQLETALDLIESLTETLALYETERVRILQALTRPRT